MQKITFEPESLHVIAKKILENKVCVLPTDTLYGFSSSALNGTAVERIYALKQRENDKPFIILIPNINSLSQFDIKINPIEENFLNSNWPAKLTVALNCNDDKFKYLHRGKKSLGFRVPNFPLLQKLLTLTGPIVSTTVNRSGEKPAETIQEAQQVFKDAVDLYVEHGKLVSPPSTVISLNNGNVTVIRQGEFVVK